MRKPLTTICAVVVAAVAAGPAGASHGTAPHDCLGKFHSQAATALGADFGAFVSDVLVRPYAEAGQAFGREFVKARATECSGLE